MSTVDDYRFAPSREAGAKWVASATPEELAELRSFADGCSVDSPDWDRIFSDDDPQRAYSVAERFYFATHPDDHGDREAASSFWCSMPIGPFEGDDDDCDFVRAFAEGAIEALG